ncbi:MAG: uracil phosphoribosyltransferase [Deltaproteobacteria bacterium]|nr:MAG: uracil phosphoribosyltransferase [Deltaproteobacteria bacterium]
MDDVQYAHLPRPSWSVEHRYGPRVHLLSAPYPMSLLARLCSPDVHQPEINRLIVRLYEWMLGEVCSRVLPTTVATVPTRMGASEPRGVYRGQVVARRQPVVVVDIARAGMLPALTVYDRLHDIIEADCLRQDHVLASRRTDAEGRVVGLDVADSKIGGPVSGAMVMLPDPMAATGTSIDTVLQTYAALEGGPPARVVCMHLIATPEYLMRMAARHPDTDIFAIRLDRGLSAGDVLRTVPGERWPEEVGLNGVHYIVPGAGGVGELLNNAWV